MRKRLKIIFYNSVFPISTKINKNQGTTRKFKSILNSSRRSIIFGFLYHNIYLNILISAKSGSMLI